MLNIDQLLELQLQRTASEILEDRKSIIIYIYDRCRLIALMDVRSLLAQTSSLSHCARLSKKESFDMLTDGLALLA